MSSAEKCSGHLIFRLRQVLPYWIYFRLNSSRNEHEGKPDMRNLKVSPWKLWLHRPGMPDSVHFKLISTAPESTEPPCSASLKYAGCRWMRDALTWWQCYLEAHTMRSSPGLSYYWEHVTDIRRLPSEMAQVVTFLGIREVTCSILQQQFCRGSS
jgi:hypothetical protein